MAFNLKTTFLALTFFLTFPVCASVQVSEHQEPAKDFSVLTGTWEGSFLATSPTPNAEPVSTEIILRLIFEQNVARIFVKNENIWKEVEPGLFTTKVLGTNALIYLVHAGKIPTDDGSRWFETYLVAATAQSENKLLIRWLRVVNNIDTAQDNPDRSFTVDGEGTLTKVESASGD